MQTLLLTTAALLAFAANSLLCRAALGSFAIDPVSFTTLRIASGAAILAVIAFFTARDRKAEANAGFKSIAALFVYMIGFSLAYIDLGAGTGALILFGSVQLTMLLAAIRAGERPAPREWIGLLLALSGLVVLVLPGLSAPSIAGAALMAAAGVGWGIYSILGRNAGHALTNTTRNFLGCVPPALVLSLLAVRNTHFTAYGVALALASGMLASGLGYAIWYTALKGLTSTRAATVQLAVPVVAAFGGVALLGEIVSLRLIGAATLILGGIALAVLARR